MAEPSQDQWREIFARIEAWDHLSLTAIARELEAFAKDTTDPTVLNYLQLHYRLPQDPFQFSAGDKVSEKYKVLAKLGQGGMGVVYLAAHEVTGKEAALKFIHPGLFSEPFSRRFRQEIEILGRLDYRGIVRIFDAAVHRDGHHSQEALFYAMEYVPGEPITEYARKTECGVRENLQLVIQVCEALRYAHDRRIAHMDIKPSNILVQSDGFPMVLDFGLAEVFDRTIRPGTEPSRGSFCSGTPLYMSPEQAAPARFPSKSRETSDIYAIGVLLYELLARRLPISVDPAASPARVREAICEEEPRSIKEFNRSYSDRLAAVVRKVLRKDPSERFQSVAALTGALQECVEETFPARAPRALRSRWHPAADAMLPSSQWIMQAKIGEGSVGEVWVGRHQRTKELRAFKFCANPDRLRLLKREITLLRVLQQKFQEHPNISRLYEVSLDEQPYFLMVEYAPAGDLRSWVKRVNGSVPIETALAITAQIADGLQAAHDAGILHRDVKPSNVLIHEKGSGGVIAKLADFGIGQVISEDLLAQITKWGFTQTISFDGQTGTHFYMAPELFAGKAASIRSDVYALGVVLYQLLMGDFDRPLPSDWMKNISDPFLREDLALCFSGDPQERFSGVSQLACRLRTISQRRRQKEEQEAEAVRAEQQARRKRVARKVLLATAGATALTALGLALEQEARRNSLRNAEWLLSEAAEARDSHRAGRTIEGETKLASAINLLKDAQPVAKWYDLRSTALALSDSLDLVQTETGKFPPGGPVLAICPATKQVARTNQQTIIVVQGWQDGRVAATLSFPEGRIQSLEFSPSGRFLLALTEKGGSRGATVWELAAGKIIMETAGPIMAAKFSRSERQLALVKGDHLLQIHTLPGANVLDLRFEVPFSTDMIAWSSQDRYVALGSRSSLNLFVWDLHTPEAPARRLYDRFGPPTALAWDENEPVLSTGTERGEARFWSGEDGREVRSLKQYETPVTRLATDLRSGWVLGYSEDSALTLSSLDQRERVNTFITLPNAGMRLDHASSLLHRLTFWNEDGYEVWRIKPRAVRSPWATLEERPWTEASILLLESGACAVLYNQALFWYDLFHHREIGRIEVPGIKEMALARNKLALILGGRQGLFSLPFSIDPTGTPAIQLGDLTPITAPEDVGTLASETESGQFQKVVAHGSHLHFLEEGPLAIVPLSFTPQKVAVSSGKKWIALRDKKTGRTSVFKLPIDKTSHPVLTFAARDFAFAGDSLLACDGRSLRVWNDPESPLTRTVELSPHDVATSLTIDQASQLCVVGAGNYLYWVNYTTAEKILRLQSADGEAMRALRFSPDRKHLAAFKANGKIEVWDLSVMDKILGRFALAHSSLKGVSSESVSVPGQPLSLASYAFLPDGATNQWISRLERIDDQLAQAPHDYRLAIEAGTIFMRLADFKAAVARFRTVAREHFGANDLYAYCLAAIKAGEWDEASSLYNVLKSEERPPAEEWKDEWTLAESGLKKRFSVAK